MQVCHIPQSQAAKHDDFCVPSAASWLPQAIFDLTVSSFLLMSQTICRTAHHNATIFSPSDSVSQTAGHDMASQQPFMKYTFIRNNMTTLTNSLFQRCLHWQGYSRCEQTSRMKLHGVALLVYSAAAPHQLPVTPRLRSLLLVVQW